MPRDKLLKRGTKRNRERRLNSQGVWSVVQSRATPLPIPDAPSVERIPPPCPNIETDLLDLDYPSDENKQEPSPTSRHTKEKQTRETEWASQRLTLLNAIVDLEAMPSEQRCSMGHDDIVLATCRCFQCGGNTFYCDDCCKHVHSIVLGHSPEIWETDGVHGYRFKPMDLLNRIVIDRTGASMTSVEIDVVGYHGVSKTVVEYPSEYSVVLGLVNRRIFPASPQRPTVGFTFEFLDTLLSLCVSVKGAVISGLMDGFGFTKYNKQVVEALREYTYYHTVVNSACVQGHVSSHIELVCTACDSDHPKVSLDGDFKLALLKKAGDDVRLPLLTGVMLPQNEMDRAGQVPVDEVTNNCNNFIAMNIPRATRGAPDKKTESKYQHQAILDLDCAEHDVPLISGSIKTGERYGYYRYMINEYCKRMRPKEMDIILDVGCHFDASNRANGFNVQGVKLHTYIPAFHIYGHKLNCHLKYGLEYAIERGWCDGEACERVWSQMNGMSKLTRNMRPSFRIELFSMKRISMWKAKIQNMHDSLVRKKALTRKLLAVKKREWQEMEDIPSYEAMESMFVNKGKIADTLSRKSDLKSMHTHWVNRKFHKDLLKTTLGTKASQRVSKAYKRATSGLDRCFKAYNRKYAGTEDELSWQQVNSGEFWGNLSEDATRLRLYCRIKRLEESLSRIEGQKLRHARTVSEMHQKCIARAKEASGGERALLLKAADFWEVVLRGCGVEVVNYEIPGSEDENSLDDSDMEGGSDSEVETDTSDMTSDTSELSSVLSDY